MNSADISPRPYLMRNKIQHYSWGTKGRDAFIPALLCETPTTEKPYAELWMGTHINAPSEIEMNESVVPLDALIKKYPYEMLGESVSDKYNRTFPFLLKILSAGEALSIQAHPDKKQAELLHRNDPHNYPDNNHKPEIAIALDSLTALAGIKKVEELTDTINAYPEIGTFVGKDTVRQLRSATNKDRSQTKQMVQHIFEKLLEKSEADKNALFTANHLLKERLMASGRELLEEEKLFLELEKKYTCKDVGLLFIFLLRLVHLREGESLFIQSGIPHAYLKGNIIECMSNSDNVVRVGLTPKFRDTKTLMKIINYDTNHLPVIRGNPEMEEIIYNVPIEEFKISRLRSTPGRKRKIETSGRPSILLVTSGKVRILWQAGPVKNMITVTRGRSVFIPAVLPEFKVDSEEPAVFFKVDAC